MESVISHPLFIPLIVALCIICLAPLAVAGVVLLERKVLADIQVRLGPMRVGPHGLLQTVADALKMLLKEDIIPNNSNKGLFRFAPVISFFTAAISLSVIPYSEKLRVVDTNVGLLIISSMSAVGILGIILGGWSSNSHYSLLGSLRSAAQLVSYEVALGMALISGVMAAGTRSLVEIVKTQQARGIWLVFDNYGLMILPFMIYFISGVAETYRCPVDLPEAESELVAGYHTEYSGFRWGIYMLSEYLNMFVLGGVVITLFWGGWLRPFPSMGWLEIPVNYGIPIAVFAGTGLWCFPASRKLPSAVHRGGLVIVGLCLLATAALFAIPAVNASLVAPFWFFLKLSIVLYVMIWVRGTFPRYRYDQLMDIGWKWMIPLGLAAILVNALVGVARG
ncbi:MAG TPA: NADH-quinone oxidoreductase subunit NuoH [Bryobacteraceae bacterium]|nr:NADH-quinone oxidoreductase subunit NuoH [Bryobacteraceae bacterium]